jgi:alkylation response protein AidB-like acyl-CoA dehydrogenase
MKYLVPLAKGEVIGAFLPVRARGRFRCYFSKTTAIDKGDYLLNGTKNWITNGSSASTYIVIAKRILKGIKELTLL